MATRIRPVRALPFVVVGSIVLSVGLASAARADDYPTWDQVQAAQQNQAATEAEIAKIQAILVGLESDAAALEKDAQIKGEAYNTAKQSLDDATSLSTLLDGQAASAQFAADQSTKRAAQLVAQVARTTGGSLPLTLFLSSDSQNLLSTLGTMSKLSEQAAAIYRQAVTDRNVAKALGEQATLAKADRAAAATTAQKSLAAAQAAAAAVQQKIADQQAASDQLYAQLAVLKGTTADIEQRYVQGLTASQPTPPAPVPPANPPSDPTPPVDNTPDPPNSSAAAGAIAFAEAHLGDSYVYGGYGPDSWDCSGLTKAAYASVGVYIGVHGATSQYNYLASLGRLVPLSELAPGDLLFYSDGGTSWGDKYHTTIYIGGGQMIEAAYEGVPVRAVGVRSYDLVPYAARPTG
jgi:cell wall-associated NlpC family hydrolase